MSSTNRNIELATEIAAYVKRKGGTPTAAARELDIKYTPSIRNSLKELEPDIDRYRYAFQRIGEWMTLPTDFIGDRNKQRITCMCCNCGAIKEVSLLNLISKRSLSCKTCALKNRSNITVIADDGELFNSIRSFVRSLGKDTSYQSIRHILQSDGSITINSKTYALQS